MNCFKHIKVKWLFLFPLLLLAEKGMAQMYTDGNQMLLPSPQVWSFMKYGNTPVNLHTGTVAVDIPIYTYKDNDFEIPISIGYASNGLRPGIRAGVLGKDWFLNVGGVITREIRGWPDELGMDPYLPDFSENTDIAYRTPGFDSNFGLYDYAPNSFSYAPEQNFFGGSYIGGHYLFNYTDGYYWYPTRPDLITVATQRSNGITQHEVQNDIFHFNFGNFKGSFVVLREGNIEVFHTNVPQGEIKIKKIGHGFIITTSDGYEYHFDSTESYDLSEINDIPWSTYKTNPTNCISSWFLDSIVAPNKRKVEFNYGMRPSIETYRPVAHMPSVSLRIDGKDRLIEHNVYTPSGGNSLNITIKNHSVSSLLLTSRKVDNLNIDFSYLSSDKLTYETVTPLGGMDRSTPKIEKIKVWYSSSSNILEEASFNYDQTANGVMFLHKVITRNKGEYAMDYYDRTNYPPMGTYSIDKWGYYNARNMGTNGSYFVPALKLDANYNEIVVGTDYRAPSGSAALQGMLKTIIYPTKGKTEFVYEPHSYSSAVVRDHSSNFRPYLKSDISKNTETGGVRIKKITDYSDNNTISNVREFEYVNAKGNSSGILLDDTRYSLLYHANGYEIPLYYSTRDGIVLAGSRTVLGGPLGKISGGSQTQNTMDKTHIEYTQVKEKRYDGSSVINYYINYSIDSQGKDNPELFSIEDTKKSWCSQARVREQFNIMQRIGYNSLNWIIAPDENYILHLSMDLPGSLHHYRGRIMKREVFDSSNRRLEMEEYYYDSPLKESIMLPGIKSFIMYHFSIPTGQSPLTKTVKTEYLDGGTVATTTEYSYNALGQCTEERKTDSRGNTVRVRRQFPHDILSSVPSFVTDMKNKQVIRYPLKEITTLQSSGGPEVLTGGNKYLYKTKTVSGRSFIVPEKVQSVAATTPPALPADKFSIDGYLNDEITYTAYDNWGNLVHSTDRNNVPTTYIWGYNGRFLVAVVKNKTPANLISVSGLNTITTTPLTGALTDAQGTALRNLSGSLVTTYTHDPLVGVTSITDPSGRKTSYTYDTEGRLSEIRDDAGNLLERYEYNYKQ
jgi:YD repeat-containing protein